MMDHLDHIRLLLLQEPRGYPCQNANAIVPPSCGSPARFGFIIMEQNKIYPAMSGHNTICVATALVIIQALPPLLKIESVETVDMFSTKIKSFEACYMSFSISSVFQTFYIFTGFVSIFKALC